MQPPPYSTRRSSCAEIYNNNKIKNAINATRHKIPLKPKRKSISPPINQAIMNKSKQEF